MRVLGIGESILDQYIVEKVLKNGQRSRRRLPGLRPGGTVPAALVFLARHGISCDFVTSLGLDAEAAMLTEALRTEGIALKSYTQARTKINTIIDDVNGQRTKLHSSIVHTPIKNLDESYLADFDLVIVDRHERAAFYELLRKKSPHTKIMIDPSTEVSDFTLAMMREADYPILPIESLIPLNGNQGFLTASSLAYEVCQKPFIVTLGELGSLRYDGHHMEFLPALPVEAIDTCGAGDVYRGAFAYGVLQGWDARRAAHYANVAAGLQCTKLGNLPAIPDKPAVEKNLRKPRRRISLRHVDEYFRKLVASGEFDTAAPLSIGM